jgi:starch synthase (maltosyl-transferring)
VAVTARRAAAATKARNGQLRNGQLTDGRRRVVIEDIWPQIDGGRFPVKRIQGDVVTVWADVFADGHDQVAALLLYRREGESDWRELPMEHFGNDRWRASFTVEEIGRYEFTVEGWVDHFRSWRHGIGIKVDAGQDVAVDLQMGADLVETASRRASGTDARKLKSAATAMRPGARGATSAQIAQALDAEMAALAGRYPDRNLSTRYERPLGIVVDRPRAQFSTWYELFPRSTGKAPGEHGTFKTVEARLPEIAEMGFDVLYFPPIHPIGKAFRKGRNNTTQAGPNDPGSPWGIGSNEGGHKSVHPQLGTIKDFDRLVARAAKHGMEIALDIAYQCSPDHPYAKEHPEWFRTRPDGTIQYAENPPKKYEDIYPINFESEAWHPLWEELKSIVDFWIDHGVRIFRVDNPHTKPFPFWEWMIGEVTRAHPDVLFLAEAFTRPKIMYRLAKLGFSQSYTYFTWRNTKEELTEYLTELTQTSVREFFRPNFWPNTPDILHQSLQTGGRGMFFARLVLAGTLSSNYGMYGPAYELLEHLPKAEGTEEYLNSEKYEIRHWDLDDRNSLRNLIAGMNAIRQENPALHSNASLRFHAVDNPQIIAYSKHAPDQHNHVLVIVNLDPQHTQSGWVTLQLADFGIQDVSQPFEVHDLLAGVPYEWTGPTNFVQLDPLTVAHIFAVRP